MEPEMGVSGFGASLINNVEWFRSIEELEEAFICCDSKSCDSLTVLDDSLCKGGGRVRRDPPTCT